MKKSEMNLIMIDLLSKGLKKHPIYEHIYCLPTGEIYSVYENYIHACKGNMSKDGYLRIGFRINGKYKNIEAHRLIAETFLENPEDLPQVNHIDENRLNNNADNLEWCTPSWNICWSKAKSVRAFDKDGNWLGDFTNMNIAADYFGCSSGAIRSGKLDRIGVTFVPIDNRLKTVMNDWRNKNPKINIKY